MLKKNVVNKARSSKGYRLFTPKLDNEDGMNEDAFYGLQLAQGVVFSRCKRYCHSYFGGLSMKILIFSQIFGWL
jgi:hypothetical protein